MVVALEVILGATRTRFCSVDSMGFSFQFQSFGALGGKPAISTPSCSA